MIREYLPLTGKIWSLYAEFVHNALFFELVAHEMPQGFLFALIQLLEQHEKLVIIVLAALLSVWKHLRSTEPSGTSPRRKNAKRPRATHGSN
jgi:hypothetical protein